MAVMAIRSDYLGQLQSAAALTARFEEFSLGPMPLARIPQIIQGPAKVAGVNVEEAFVQQAARDAATEDALPLLAFALRELWDRSPNKLLSLDGYKALGDEKAALTPLETRCAKPPTRCWSRRSRTTTNSRRQSLEARRSRSATWATSTTMGTCSYATAPKT